MPDFEMRKLLERQTAEMATMLHRHESEMSRRLVEHRHKQAELMLASTPALQEEVLGGMQRWLEGIIEYEAGLADAEDARRLLHVVQRMQRTIAEKGKL